ncbi:hypothetical protein ACVIGA_009012 [Bradyrhizobium sp. USDA 3240]
MYRAKGEIVLCQYASPSCLVPRFDGAFLSHDSKDALWISFTRLRQYDGGSPSSNTNSQENLRGLAKRYGINQKTVAKWKQRETVADRSTGPKEVKSTVLSIEEEAIAEIVNRGAKPVIPNKSNRVTLHSFSKRVYKGRNVIERCFCRVKDFRRVATRYDKLARNFLAAVHLAAMSLIGSIESDP